MTPSRQKRLVRLLGALRAGRADVSSTADGATLILRIKGERQIRCDRDMLGQMIDSGWVDRRTAGPDGQCSVALTEDGASYWRRARAGGDFAAQQRIEEAVRVPGGDPVTVNRAESPLTRLARPTGARPTPWIDRAQLAAGERLRRDFERAQLRQKVTMNWDVSCSAGRSHRHGAAGAELSDSAIDARRRFERALDAMDPDLRGVLVDVCCFLKGLEQVEVERQWPRRSAKLVLRVGLNALDRHYHPPAPAPGPSRTRNWGAPGFRPSLST